MPKKSTQEINSLFDAVNYDIFIVLAGLVLPVLLIFLVRFTGYSEILEEVAKMLVVFFLVLKLPSLRSQVVGSVIFGFLFGLSENIFYLINFFALGNFTVFWQRFIWVLPMHIVTVLVILFSGRFGKKFIIFGLAGAIILHMLFNSYMMQAILLK